ncbi:MAG: hypothetical protein BGP10_12500 [Rhodanobacter sp. 68-29]|nr:MAG: hypothetical protein ABT19_00415 [Rhodanobacter sp. SCN 68-63]OJY60710.1 MAG: hypothetical protein BGP10_12500 [Rhodanobacter sp. 68-29]
MLEPHFPQRRMPVNAWVDFGEPSALVMSAASSIRACTWSHSGRSMMASWLGTTIQLFRSRTPREFLPRRPKTMFPIMTSLRSSLITVCFDHLAPRRRMPRLLSQAAIWKAPWPWARMAKISRTRSTSAGTGTSLRRFGLSGAGSDI